MGGDKEKKCLDEKSKKEMSDFIYSRFLRDLKFTYARGEEILKNKNENND